MPNPIPYPIDPSQAQKRLSRNQMLARREAQADKETLSRRIWERMFALEAYHEAQTVLCYVDVRSEVNTRIVFLEILASGRRLVVPYCAGDELKLFWLKDLSELARGRFGILEPDPAWQARPERKLAPDQLDLLIVPGVVFDRQGGRIGHGFGYYDRLLAHVPPWVPKVGLAFECQMIRYVPTEPHDVPMDAVITEQAVYLSHLSAS